MISLLQTIYDERQIKKDQNSITDDDEEDEKKEQPQVIRTRSKTKIISKSFKSCIRRCILKAIMLSFIFCVHKCTHIAKIALENTTGVIVQKLYKKSVHNIHIYTICKKK